MRSLTICCCLAALAACAKPEPQAAKDSTAAPLGAGAPTPISLAAVTGKWTMRTMAANSDSTLLTFDLVATADSSGWTFNFPNRAPVPIRVLAIAGDSIVTEAGPYESALRKGVKVQTHTVMRLEGGNLVGTTVAHYTTTGPDSVLNLRTSGTRAP